MVTSELILAGESSFSHEELPEFETVRGVNGQHGDGDLADVGQADKARAIPGKMRVPGVLAWMKEPYNFPGGLQDACDVRPLIGIAVQTAISEVCQTVRASVFGCNDMINLERQRCGAIGQLTVFAEAISSLADLLLQKARNGHARLGSRGFECQTSFRMQQVQQVADEEILLQFLPFNLREFPITILLS